MLVNGECYLCGGTEFNKRPGSVRDNPLLEVLECASCGLVFLSSFDHIRNDFYENSEMHKGQEMLDIQVWLNQTVWDDEQHVKPVTYSVIKHGIIGLTKYLA